MSKMNQTDLERFLRQLHDYVQYLPPEDEDEFLERNKISERKELAERTLDFLSIWDSSGIQSIH